MIKAVKEPFITSQKAHQELLRVLQCEESINFVREFLHKGFLPQYQNMIGVAVNPDTIPDTTKLHGIDADELHNSDTTSFFIPFLNKDKRSLGFLNVLISNIKDGAQQRAPIAAWASEVTLSYDKGRDEFNYEITTLTQDQDNETGRPQVAGENASPTSSPVSEIDRYQGSISASRILSENTTQQSGASTQSLPDWPDALSAATCFVLVEEVCDKYGDSITKRACASICFRTANPWAIAGCGVACLAITEIIERYGCKKGPQFLCGLLLG